MSVLVFAIFTGTGVAAQDDDPLPPAVPGGAPTRDWAAWTSVPRLRGESQAQVFNTNNASNPGSTVTTERGMSRDWATVRMELEIDPDTNLDTIGRKQIWRVLRATGSGGTNSNGHKSGPHLVEDIATNGSYQGPMNLRVKPGLSLDLRTGEWGFSTLHQPERPWTTSTDFSRSDWGREVRNSDTSPGRSLEHSWIKDTAPRQAVLFTGTFSFSESGPGQGSNSVRTMDRTARVLFWPDWNDVEVLVEIANYPTWRPQGNIADSGQPGPEPLELTATLRPKAKNPTPAQMRALPAVRRFRFELIDTSREPGVCMNWPVFGPDASSVPPEDPKPDLSFEPMSGFKAVLSPKRQKIGVSPLVDAAGLPTARARMVCFDFGAYADLRVIAELVDGREITGYIEAPDGPRYIIRIPDRPDGSLIARVWRDAEKYTGDDAADDDNTPLADEQKGDGFSAYEEYRGFAVRIKHKSLKPAIKDLFVLNLIGPAAREGLDLFEAKTGDGGERGFKVHDRIFASEMPDSREMNLNRSARSPRTARESQHGLELVPLYSGAVSEADFDGKEDSVAWRPKNVRKVYVLANLANSNPRDFASTIAHEISHAIGGRHHGTGDLGIVYWDLETTYFPKDDTTWSSFRESAATRDAKTGKYGPDPKRAERGEFVQLFLEDGRELNPNDPSAAKDFIKHFKEPVGIYVGCQHGQHSGDDECWMRYDVAGAYVPPNRQNDRIVVQFPVDALANDAELPGLEICDAPIGTGVNDPKRRVPVAAVTDPKPEPPPGPRYGNAKQGNCRQQLCVRDDAPDRFQAATP